MIIWTVFLLIMNPTEIRWVHNQKENCPYDHIPFNFKGIVRLFCVNFRIKKDYSDWACSYQRDLSSCHHEGSNKGSPEATLKHHGNIVPRSLRRILDLASILPRDVSLSAGNEIFPVQLYWLPWRTDLNSSINSFILMFKNMINGFISTVLNR